MVLCYTDEIRHLGKREQSQSLLRVRRILLQAEHIQPVRDQLTLLDDLFVEIQLVLLYDRNHRIPSFPEITLFPRQHMGKRYYYVRFRIRRKRFLVNETLIRVGSIWRRLSTLNRFSQHFPSLNGGALGASVRILSRQFCRVRSQLFPISDCLGQKSANFAPTQQSESRASPFQEGMRVKSLVHPGRTAGMTGSAWCGKSRISPLSSVGGFNAHPVWS